MVGDGENDLELIRAAGLGIAMGNAPDLVQQAADRVVNSVGECGLEQALDMLRERYLER
jgi:hydroxymethylpyrimidine pyrophosphatase-like HAD family hydrolase